MEDDDDVEDEEDDEDEEGAAATHPPKKTARYALAEVPAALESEFAAYSRWRREVLNPLRSKKAASETTVANDKGNALRFFGWCGETGRLPAQGARLSLFGSSQMGTVAHAYVAQLQAEGRTMATAATYVSSFICYAQWVVSVRRQRAPRGAAVDTSAVEQLGALHKQCAAAAAQETKFKSAQRKATVLPWDGVQRARAAAEKALAEAGGEDAALARDVAALLALTHSPPDRVSVVREFELGKTLRASADGGYLLDLSEPGQHKTSAATGPTRTTVPTKVCAAIDKLLELEGRDSGFIFASAAGATAPLSPTAWGRFVKRLFERYAGVSVTPKDLRASFVTWLKTGDHGDHVLKAAAAAMRHSSSTQASAAYHLGASDQAAAAAVKAASDFAARF